MFVSFSPAFGEVKCLSNDPKFDVTIKSKNVEIEKVNYKPGYGQHSFEAISEGMKVVIILNNKQVKEYKCDRMIEEFNKLLLIKDFEQISFKMEDIQTIYVRK